MDTIQKLPGSLFTDDRGLLRFVNDFDMSKIKRFYQVENFELSTIRAFHGHMKEEKYVYVTSGTILLCLVKLTDTTNPSKDEKVERIVISARNPQIVTIPAGYANGFKSLEKDTSVIFFSTSSLDESKGDDYRFSHDYWGNEIWNIQFR